jgi:hypothetical protein
MRHIAILADERVPGNAEFRFKDRADALVKKWQQILNAASKGQTQNGSSPTTGGGGGAGGAGGGDIISAGPISAVTGLMREESDAGVVTKGTAAIDLNGKAVGEGVFRLLFSLSYSLFLSLLFRFFAFSLFSSAFLCPVSYKRSFSHVYHNSGINGSRIYRSASLERTHCCAGCYDGYGFCVISRVAARLGRK